MLDDILLLIENYGYIALFGLLAAGIVGIPIPDEILMTTVGSLTTNGGPLTLGMSFLASFAGTMTGMIVSYTLGRTVGKPFLYRYGKWVKLTPSRLDVAEAWFKKYGMWTVVFGYYVPGIRHFTCYLAGVSVVSFWRYLMFAGTGAFLWCASFLALGHFIGQKAPVIMEIAREYLGVCAAVIIGLAVIGIYIYWRYRKRAASRQKTAG